MVPSITMTDCPDCGCGEQECAEVGVTCGCCGNFQFIPGDPSTIQAQFYNWELSCDFCGVTWHGHSLPAECTTPEIGTNTFHYLGSGTYYRYIGAGYKWMYTDDLTYAIHHRTFGSIFDNCGNEVPVQ